MAAAKKLGSWTIALSLMSTFVSVTIFAKAPAVPQAEETLAGSVNDEAKEAEVVQMARRRLYNGGRDEGQLKVQAQLLTPTRKMTPQSESNEQPSDD